MISAVPSPRADEASRSQAEGASVFPGRRKKNSTRVIRIFHSCTNIQASVHKVVMRNMNLRQIIIGRFYLDDLLTSSPAAIPAQTVTRTYTFPSRIFSLYTSIPGKIILIPVEHAKILVREPPFLESRPSPVLI